MNNRQKFNKWKPSHGLKRPISIFIFLLCLLGLVTSTQAWQSSSQRAVNMGKHTTQKQDVHLIKLAKELDGSETNNPIPNTVFALYQVKETGDEQVGGYIMTDEKGKLSLSLSPGEYFVEEVTPSTGYTFDKDDKGEIIKRYYFTITNDTSNKEPLIQMYNLAVSGSLEISKRIECLDGEQISDEQKSILFEFTVTFSDNGRYQYKIDNGEAKWLKSGQSLQLTHGQKAVFTNIPEGVHYTVTETPVLGYNSFANNTSGTVTTTPSVVNYINQYVSEKGQLEISKKIERVDGEEISGEQKEKEFTFKAVFSDNKTSYPYKTSSGREGFIKSGEIFTLTHEETMYLTDLPIGLTYSIEEQYEENYLSQNQSYQGTIVSTGSVYTPFINEYGTSENTTSELQFKKEVVGEMPEQSQEFTFKVSFNDGKEYSYRVNDGPVTKHKSGELINISANDIVTFLDLPIGTHYEIVEQSISGYQAETNKVEGSITETLTQFIFNNHVLDTASIVVKKVGEGEGFDLDHVFSFRLWINDKEQEELIKLKAGEQSTPILLHVGDTWRVEEVDSYSEGYSQTSLINGVGIISEKNQQVEITQTNKYTKPVLGEISGTKKWVVPSDVSISIPESITIHLMDDDKVVETKRITGPDWTYTFKVPLYNELGEEINYTIKEEPIDYFWSKVTPGTIDLTNTYIPPVNSSNLIVEKSIVGDTPDNDSTFNFRIQPSNKVITITGAGKIELPTEKYTHPGIYEYTITEDNLGELGYTYDTSVYVRTVVVKETDGKLVIASDSITKDGIPYTDNYLIFTNKFTESRDTVVSIEGQKTWIHGENPTSNRPEKLTIYLYGNDTLVQQRQISSLDDWHYKFTVPKFDKNGEVITYSIGEEKVDGYKMSVKGWDLTNTFEGSKSSETSNTETKKPTGFLPQTSEDRLVIGIMTLIVIVLSGGYLYKKIKDSEKID